jgi:hypothetical protein
MDIYIDLLCDLAGYLRKNAQIDTHIFTGEGPGLQCVLIPESIEMGGPEMGPRIMGRELSVTVRISGPRDNWKQVMTYMGRIEEIINNCDTGNNELKIKYRLTLGAWSRTEDETNIIFDNSLEVKAVRLNT